MKVFATLASLFLLINSIYALAAHHHHSRHHSSKHHHEKSVFQSRASAGSCDWKCTDQNGNQVTTDTIADNSWAIDIVGGSNVVLTFMYNVGGILAIYNRATNYIYIFVSNTGYYAVMNINNNVGLVVNMATGFAKYLPSNNIIPSISSVFAAGNLVTGVSNIISLIGLAVPYLLKPYAVITDPYMFKFDQYIANMKATTFPDPLAAKPLLKPALANNLGSFINAIKSRIPNAYNANCATLNSLIGVVGTIPALQILYRDIICNAAKSGFSTGKGTAIFAGSFLTSVYIGGFLNGTLNTASFNAAGGSITISGPTVSPITLTNAGTQSPYLNENIDVSNQFSAMF